MTKNNIDTEHYKIHWEHTANLYQDLSNYFEFMVCDGNIEKPTYDLLTSKLFNIGKLTLVFFSISCVLT